MSRSTSRRIGGQGLWVWPPVAFVLLLVVVPLVYIALFSVGLRSNIPGTKTAFDLGNWKDFLFGENNPFRALFWHSLLITVLVSVAVTIAAYPLAYFLSFVARKNRYTLLLLVLAPFFTSFLLRVIAWQIILNENGVINSFLWWAHLRPQGESVTWLIYSNFSVVLVLFYSWIPFVALPMFVVMENMDRRLLEAAEDLGASRFTAFTKVTLPLSIPGIIAGFVFVLIPTTGEFITPLLVGGPESQLFGNQIQSFFSDSPDWNYGSVLAMTLILLVLVLMVIFGRFLSADLRRPTAESA